MKTTLTLIALLFSSTAACHKQQLAGENFVSAEAIIPGEKSSIVAATDRVVRESQFIVERRMMLQEGKLLIVAHPIDKPEAAGSIRLSLVERGSDDTSVRVEISSALYPSSDSARTIAKETLRKVQTALNK